MANSELKRYLDKAYALRWPEDKKEFLALGRQLCKQYPRCSDVWALRGMGLSSTGHRRAALAAYKKGLSLAPGRAYFHYYIGATLFYLKDYRAARKELTQALGGVWPIGQPVQDSCVCKLLGKVYTELGNSNAALWCYIKADEPFSEIGVPWKSIQEQITALRQKSAVPKKPAWARTNGPYT